ncbi:MAG: biotin carboxylase N-terminal domain-containing protein [Pseudomonadota bacterium]
MSASFRPISRVLIANRGEIACRIARTLRATGRTTIAIYSDADAGAPHVAAADVALPIGPPPVSESYLDIERIVAAAVAADADAIHPGYGFLSENAEFAAACEAAGLIFIGPGVEAIALMGNKAAARQRMQAAGVPCVPGYDGDAQDDTALTQAAAKIGYPVMVKAAAGGGGRGMRIVEQESALTDALSLARAEALSAFGSDQLILERAVVAPRHVEVQVLADAHGTTLHLGERDCSVQRRHQKVIEEAPSPAVDAELRARMGAAAVAAAADIDYRGAGTVEFLLDADGSFFFLEMNTRLQVEHPVTESITGLDLVALQLDVAEGRPLPFGQDDVRLAGHSIEVRLYAEDPTRDFLPQTGDIALWRPAAGVRTDAGIETGDIISPHYDPLLAKIIAHGRDRATARRRLVTALEDTVLLGITHNRDFLRAALEHEAFAAGEATTHFIDDHAPQASTSEDAAVLRLAAVAWYRARMSQALAQAPSINDELEDWSSATPLAQSCPFVSEASVQVTALGGGSYAIDVDGEVDTLTVVGEAAGRLTVESGGALIDLDALLDDDTLHLSCAEFAGQIGLAQSSSADADQSGDTVAAPMHGKVMSIDVGVGDTVRADQRVAVVEAMKMQHAVTAPRDGRVSAVHCAEGDQVDADALLIELEPETE